MIEFDEDTFIKVCGQAMRLGWTDGTRLTTPRNTDDVAAIVGLPIPRAIIHKRKLRQAYGVAFDISRIQHLKNGHSTP